MRRALVAMAVAFASAAIPSVAAAQLPSPTSFRGVTTQGRDILFALQESGRVGTVQADWDARCRNGTRFEPQSTQFEPPAVPEGAVGPVDQTLIEGVGRYRVAERGGRIARVTVVIAGKRRGPVGNPAAQEWNGTLRVRAVMHRHGRLVDRCTLRTRWRARGDGFGAGTWDMVPDTPPAEAIGPWRHEPPRNPMRARGTRDAVTVESGTVGPEGSEQSPFWTASFSAPALNRLEPGRTYTVRDDVTGGARMSVQTDVPAECDTDVSFTIERIAFDRLKRLRSLRVSFVERCDDGRSTWRGVIDWRASP